MLAEGRPSGAHALDDEEEDHHSPRPPSVLVSGVLIPLCCRAHQGEEGEDERVKAHQRSIELDSAEVRLKRREKEKLEGDGANPAERESFPDLSFVEGQSAEGDVAVAEEDEDGLSTSRLVDMHQIRAKRSHIESDRLQRETGLRRPPESQFGRLAVAADNSRRRVG